MPYKLKSDRRRAAKRHYEANKADYVRRAAAFTAKVKKRISEYIRHYLSEHPCVDCGEADPVVLDFDHVRGRKKYDVSTMKSLGLSLSAVEAEIAKCEVRCANCHRRVTHKRRMEERQLKTEKLPLFDSISPRVDED